MTGLQAPRSLQLSTRSLHASSPWLSTASGVSEQNTRKPITVVLRPDDVHRARVARVGRNFLLWKRSFQRPILAQAESVMSELAQQRRDEWKQIRKELRAQRKAKVAASIDPEVEAEKRHEKLLARDLTGKTVQDEFKKSIQKFKEAPAETLEENFSTEVALANLEKLLEPFDLDKDEHGFTFVSKKPGVVVGTEAQHEYLNEQHIRNLIRRLPREYDMSKYGLDKYDLDVAELTQIQYAAEVLSRGSAKLRQLGLSCERQPPALAKLRNRLLKVKARLGDERFEQVIKHRFVADRVQRENHNMGLTEMELELIEGMAAEAETIKSSVATGLYELLEEPLEPLPDSVLPTPRPPCPLEDLVCERSFHYLEPEGALIGPHSTKQDRERKFALVLPLHRLRLPEASLRRLLRVAGPNRLERSHGDRKVLLRITCDRYPTLHLNKLHARQIARALIEDALLVHPSYLQPSMHLSQPTDVVVNDPLSSITSAHSSTSPV
eukprot:CAMPEP_0174236838 /NCGR_PEP_ID=MMETSP0417-20130205/6100_1 /TAXON_ID=242541 /ORGANISM="Mayorella sp, Strain BSH-02190019" /LENGTH=494 /DNA_ID=CAMNT_0015315533 /DNA_START=81 /DNA_END=1561 /DNA_ORIENTATION=-